MPPKKLKTHQPDLLERIRHRLHDGEELVHKMASKGLHKVEEFAVSSASATAAIAAMEFTEGSVPVGTVTYGALNAIGDSMIPEDYEPHYEADSAFNMEGDEVEHEEHSLRNDIISHFDSQITMAPRRKGRKPSTFKKRMTKRYGKVKVTRSLTVAPEIKWYENHADLAIPNNQTFAGVAFGCNPVQGTSQNTRIGRRVKVLYGTLQCRIKVYNPALVLLGGDSIVMDIWQNRDTNSVTPAFTSLYSDPHTPLAPGPDAFTNPLNQKLYKRLKRHTHQVEVAAASATTTHAISMVEMNTTRLPGHIVNYTLNAGLVTDIQDNSFIVTAVGASALTGACYTMECAWRFYYVDY